jgi:hypothetical protein
MAISEYRRNAAECLCIADEIAKPQRQLLLIAIAQAFDQNQEITISGLSTAFGISDHRECAG